MSAAIIEASDKRAVGKAYVEGFNDARGIDLVLASADGQAYAAIARDPTLARPYVLGGPAEAAYRAQRPVLAFAAWILSLGQAAAVPGALAVSAVVGAGVAGVGAGLLLFHRKAMPYLGLGVVILPGALASLGWLHPELTGLGFVLLALFLWERGSDRAAAVLFSLAGLTRETLLLVPATLGLITIGKRRPRAAFLLVPFLSWALWAVVVRLRYQAWFFELPSEFLQFPFEGPARGIGGWGRDSMAEAVVLVLTISIAVAGFLSARQSHMRALIAAHAILGTMLWSDIWLRWQDFSRVLLPLTALGGIAVLGALRPEPPGEAPGPGPVQGHPQQV